MKTRTRTGRSLGFESLERRELLAGNAWAWVEQGLLKVVADDQANCVVITAGKTRGQFVVDGQRLPGAPPYDDTLINGRKTSQTFTGVTQGIQVLTNGGADRVDVRGPSVSYKMQIPGPFGLGVDLGTGNDALYVQMVNVAASCGISGQAGNDKVYVYDSYFAWDVIVDTVGGNDFVDVKRSTIAHNLHVGTGDGNDDIRIESSGAAWMYVHAGAGDDLLTVKYCQTALQPGFDGGPGSRDRIRLGPANLFPVPANCINWEYFS